MVSNFVLKETVEVSEDSEITSNVFKFLSGDGKEHLEDLRDNILEKENQIRHSQSK